MVTVANPIYDIVCQISHGRRRIARTILSALLKAVLSPQDIASTLYMAEEEVRRLMCLFFQTHWTVGDYLCIR